MGLISGFKKRQSEQRASTVFSGASASGPAVDPLFYGMLNGGSSTAAGMNVNKSTPFRVVEFAAAVAVLADPLSHLSIDMYKVGGPIDKRVTNHPVHKILNRNFNNEHTAFEGREMMWSDFFMYGNAFAQKIRDGNNNLIALWRLDPHRMYVRREKGVLRYRYESNDGTVMNWTQADVMHLRNKTADGVLGVSPLWAMEKTLGIAQALEEYSASLYSNGANPGGALSAPGALKEDAIKRIRKQWNDAHQGPGNAHRVAVLEGGMTWSAIGMTAQDAEVLLSKKYQVEILCRYFKIPPHKLGIMDRATFSNIEQQSLEFCTETLTPHAVRYVQAVERDLLLETEQDKFRFAYNFSGLIRADQKTRFDAYAVARQWGWMCPDDIQEREGGEPLPDGQGKIYLVPENMQPANVMLAEGEAAIKAAKNPQPEAAPGQAQPENGDGNAQGQDDGNSEPDDIQDSTPPDQSRSSVMPSEESRDNSGENENVEDFAEIFEQKRSNIDASVLFLCTQFGQKWLQKEAKATENMLKTCAQKGSAEQFKAKLKAFYQEHCQSLEADMALIHGNFRHGEGLNDTLPVVFQQKLGQFAKDMVASRRFRFEIPQARDAKMFDDYLKIVEDMKTDNGAGLIGRMVTQVINLIEEEKSCA